MTQQNRNLRSILDDGPLPIARAIQIAHGVASILADAHLKGVVHGNLTPSSILVPPSGAVKIIGFGSDPADYREDIYAFGALFYEMLTQRAPVGDKLAPPSEVNPLAPRALDALVLSMLAAQPADRMPGLPILVRELQHLEEGLGLALAAAAGPQEPTGIVPPHTPGPHAPDMRGRRDPDGFAIDPDLAAGHRKQIIDREVFDHERAMRQRESREQPSASRGGMFAALLLLPAALGIGYAGYMYYSSLASKPHIAASPVPDAPAASGASAPLPVAEVKKEPVAAVGAWTKSQPSFTDDRRPPKAVKQESPDPVSVAAVANPFDPGSSAQAARPVEPKVEQPVPPPAPKKDIPRPMKATAKAPAPQPAPMAQLSLAVSPAGEIYIDGEHQGTTPPITTFELAPGMHRIEVRSGSRRPFLTYMTVEPGEVRHIRHDFNAKPSRPPA